MILIQPEKCKIHINMYRNRNLGSIQGYRMFKGSLSANRLLGETVVDTGVNIEPPVAA